MNLLLFVLYLPLAAFLAALCVPRASTGGSRMWALIASVGTFAASLGLLFWFDRGTGGEQFAIDVPWIATPNIHFAISVNGVSLWLVLLSTLLTPICVLISWNAIKDRAKEFYAFLLLLEFGLIGVFLAQDLFLFYVFWEVSLIPMYFLIGIWGHDRRIYAAVKFFLYTFAGSVLMLAAIIYLYNKTQTFRYPAIVDMLASGKLMFGATEGMVLFLAFFFAFAIKVPLFPLHTWLPDAHVEAPTAGSVMLASVMLKMGTYGILHFCLPLFPSAARTCAPWIAVLAIIGIIYGALVAMVQTDLKRLVAYSSVSHLGFVVLGLFAFDPTAVQGALYQMLNHGVSTGALFVIVGMLYDRRHTHLIREFGGLATPLPVIAAFFLFVSLASAGLPMLNGFVGEFLILSGTFVRHANWASPAAIGVILSAVYLLWAYQRVFFGEVTQEKNRTLADADRREWAVLVVMAVLILWMGIGSAGFTRRTEASTRNIFVLMQRPQAYNARAAVTSPRPSTPSGLR
jgi:NADH-quinone oxidoreductase subunit M